MAFTPTAPPPNPQHLAQIVEALCARAEARERAAEATAQKRRTLWKNDLLALRNTPPPTKVPEKTTGAAAVLEARLARICPPAKTQAKPQKLVTEQLSQDRIDAYNLRMEQYFTPVSDLPSAATSAQQVSKSAPPDERPGPPQRRTPRRSIRIMEPALAAAPARAAIAPMPVKPMLRGVHAAVKEGLQPEEEEEQVQRPNLIDAIVTAFSNFMDGVFHRNREDQEKAKEAEAVAW